MHLQKDIMNILRKTGFVCDNFNCIETSRKNGKYNIYISIYTPANSDLGFYVVYDGSFQSFKKAVSKICYAFDIDKDAEKRIPIRGSASIQTVLDESKWKKEKLDEVDLAQMSLFDTVKDDDILEELKNVDLSNMTPIDALNKLYELQNKIKNRW